MKKFIKVFVLFASFALIGNVIGDLIGVVGMGMSYELISLRLFITQAVLVLLAAIGYSIYEKRTMKKFENS